MDSFCEGSGCREASMGGCREVSGESDGRYDGVQGRGVILRDGAKGSRRGAKAREGGSDSHQGMALRRDCTSRPREEERRVFGGWHGQNRNYGVFACGPTHHQSDIDCRCWRAAKH